MKILFIYNSNPLRIFLGEQNLFYHRMKTVISMNFNFLHLFHLFEFFVRYLVDDNLSYCYEKNCKNFVKITVFPISLIISVICIYLIIDEGYPVFDKPFFNNKVIVVIGQKTQRYNETKLVKYIPRNSKNQGEFSN